jgi:hypothetical protein
MSRVVTELLLKVPVDWTSLMAFQALKQEVEQSKSRMSCST